MDLLLQGDRIKVEKAANTAAAAQPAQTAST
jgi:hypothetical protein